MSSIMPILTTPSDIFSCAWTVRTDASASVAAAAIKADFLMISSRRPAVRGRAVTSPRPRFDALHLNAPVAPRQAGLTPARPPDHHRGHDARAFNADPSRLPRGARPYDPRPPGGVRLRAHRAT